MILLDTDTFTLHQLGHERMTDAKDFRKVPGLQLENWAD